MSLASHTFRFFYVRVPRTGSATYVHYLRGCFQPHLFQTEPQHASAVDLRQQFPKEWEEYRTFGFIRNPWDWLVSLFSSGVSATPGVDENWQGSRTGISHVRTNMDFETFVRQRKTGPMDWLADENAVIVDEIMRFEDLKQHWRVRASDYNPHGPYQDWYTDELANYVADRFYREVKAGGYVF